MLLFWGRMPVYAGESFGVKRDARAEFSKFCQLPVAKRRRIMYNTINCHPKESEQTVNDTRRALCRMGLYMLLISIGILVNVFGSHGFPLYTVSGLYYIGLSAALVLYYYDRIIEKLTRRCLIGCALMMGLFLLLRSTKYIAFTEAEGAVCRHLWYFYYIPMILIFQFTFFTALSVGRKAEKLPAVRYYVRAVTLVLIVLVLTNDLHQLAFRFAPGFVNWDSDYSRCIVYYLIVVWIGLLVAATIGILFYKCRLSASRRRIWLLAFPLVFGVAYVLLYNYDLLPRINGKFSFFNLAEAMCFVTALFWECCIRIGLIGSNEGYSELFELSGTAAQIVDGEGTVVFRSGNAAVLTAEQMAAGGVVMLDENTRLHRKAIHGGTIFWQDDVTDLNRVNEELEDVRARISEEGELLRLENELKERQAQIAAKSKLYDAIVVKVLPQSQKIAALSEEAERSPEKYRGNTEQICLLAAYIKRYANLMLLTADGDTISASELGLAIRESSRCLNEMGIPSDYHADEHPPLAAQEALDAYELFEQLVEQTLPNLQAVYAALRGDILRLTLEGVRAELPERAARRGVTVEHEDNVSYVKIPFGKGGERV